MQSIYRHFPNVSPPRKKKDYAVLRWLAFPFLLIVMLGVMARDWITDREAPEKWRQ